MFTTGGFMNLRLYCLLTLFLIVSTSFSQTSFPSYYAMSDLGFTSPGALKYGLYGFDNPAMLATMRSPELRVTWNDPVSSIGGVNRFGLFAAGPGLSFGLIRHAGSFTDYRVASGFGDRSFSGGFAYGWSSGVPSNVRRSSVVSLGFLVRPNQFLSLGLTGAQATGRSDKEATADLAVRPLGTELVTLFGDYALQNSRTLREGGWSAGAVVEALPGIRFVGRYFDTKSFAVGMEISLGHLSGASQVHLDNNSKHVSTTYSVRIGGYDRNVIAKLMERTQYVEMNLLGPVKYQRFILFDDSNTLAGILNALDAAKDDQSVAGIALNTSGMNINREMLWEIREKLVEIKGAGKRVVMFVDRPGMREYYFASVADKIVMDPAGMIMMEGFVSGRTFLKGTLEKVGIGFDEWRYFAYKSAMESLSRDSMSAPDREQRQRLLDGEYALVRRGVSVSRGITEAEFERLVNEQTLLSPREALAAGLVDTLGRWDDVKKMIESLEGSPRRLTGPGTLERFNKPYDDRWGEPPKIAVIYALGECAMDQGITARKLVKDVEAAAANTSIKAIVLRVDSPGGDGMASDYIAEAMKKARKKKPVIVSQGLVAASGGYWLSMYADTIVAAPHTITGSIGVIGGWIYNAGLKETLGMTTDYVKVGKHADLGFGFTLPLIGIGLPDRNLTEEERGRAGRYINEFYSEFVAKVAAGRNTDTAAIHKIAQGRVWSGEDAKKIGLVDEIGGLETAIRIARQKAGISDDEEVGIVEYPKPGLFNFSGFFPRLIGMEVEEKKDGALEHLLFRLKHNGQPMPILPFDEMDFDVR